jgi:hypothetical protein
MIISRILMLFNGNVSPELTMDDIVSLSPKFWELHQDPMTALDGGAMTICTIQVNLAAGTIAQQAIHRPELVPIVEDLLQFRKQYVLLFSFSCYSPSMH